MTPAHRRQRTIAQAAVVHGFGYWSGADVQVQFRPAAANTGVVFVRRDLGPSARIPASVANRVEVPRRTNLVAGAAHVEMVEHVLAALSGLHIDNCEVWVDQPEMPGCDGSSLAFVEALTAAGVTEQDAQRDVIVIDRLVRLGDANSWIEARPVQGHFWTASYTLDYGYGSPIGRQSYELQITPDNFRQQLCDARTFLLKSEADWLLAQGLGARATLKDLLIFDTSGLVDNTLRHRDECVRHKLLDLVGDLALSGTDFIGHFAAHRSGHRLNAEMVQHLVNESSVATRHCA